MASVNIKKIEDNLLRSIGFKPFNYMKSFSSFKSLLILLSISIAGITASEANAYERFTWSELVTGKSNKENVDENRLSFITEWCGLSRIIKSNLSETAIIKKANQVVQNQKNYSDDELYKAVIDLRYIYKYSLKDYKKADYVLSFLNSTKLSDKAEVERLFSSMTEKSIIDNNFYERLKKLSSKNGLFPYDNGYMPIITKERVDYILSIKEMVDGKSKNLDKLPFNEFKSWKNIPSELLYKIAIGRQDKAYKEYIKAKPSLKPQIKKLIEDYLFPMYMPVRTENRKFLAALYCIEEFPNLGIDLINEALTSNPRVISPEHSLACLIDAYKKHNAINESNKVKNILKEYYPNSMWLK